MANLNRKIYKEIKEAITHGFVYPKSEGSAVFSYKRTVYVVESLYKIKAGDISISLNGEKIKEPKLAKMANGFKNLVDLSKYFTRITIRDYGATVPDMELEYFGLKNCVLSCLLRQRLR